MFNGSQNVVVNGGTFVRVSGDCHTHNHTFTSAVDDGREGVRLLQQHISLGAFHNSDERYDPPKCHPRTREAILKKLMDWAGHPDETASFLWMYGPAGAGKSAIAQTIAERCHELNLLAAAFFFSRTTAGRNSKTSLVLTLVYQLSIAIPELREYVGKAVERNPALLSMSLKAQMKALFVDALNSVASEILCMRPRLVIVDGLDECGDPDSQEYILQVLSEATNQLLVPISFLLASRPEQHIREAFNEDFLASLTTTITLDDTFQPDKDIRIFIEDKFHMIKRKHPARARFPDPWPVPSDIGHLLQKSSGQFIYAATVMKYVESRKYMPPDRLQIILGLTPSPGEDTPFAALDALYLHIFASVGDLNKVIDLFYILLLAESTAVKRIPEHMEKFLFYRPGEIDIVLSELHSILAVPASDDPQGVLRISHASLSDFLVDRSRSGRFFIDSGTGYARITTLILKHIKCEPENWYALSGLLFTHGPKAQSTAELCDALHELELAKFLNWLSERVTPKRGNGPIIFWSKVSIDNRWPNIPAFLFWMQKHRHPDPAKDLEKHITSAFDSWVHTQMSIYPSMPGTTYLLTAVTFKEIYRKEHQKVFTVVNNGVNWDPDDVADMQKVDPLQLFYLYEGAGYSTIYYDRLADFLTDESRAKEYHVGAKQYTAFAKFLLEFLTQQTLSEKDSWWLTATPISPLLPRALMLAKRDGDFLHYLESCARRLESSNTELKIWPEVVRTTDIIKAYL